MKAATSGSWSATSRGILSGANAAVDWWLRELTAFMPARLRRSTGMRLIVEATPTGLLIQKDGPNGREFVTNFENGVAGSWSGHRDGTEVAMAMLRLSAQSVLSRTITLAAAAAENLHEVVGFQLDRYAPFQPGEVYLGCEIVRVDPDVETIEVAIAIAPRTEVDKLLQLAAARGIACAHVVAATGVFGLELKLELGTSEGVSPKHRWRRMLWLGMAILLVLDAGVPLVREHFALLALQDELAAVRHDAAVVAALRDEVEQMSDLAAMPVQRWQGSPRISEVLAEITRLVPDNGWVTQMQIESGSVQLTGFSAAANALIPVLEKSQLLTNASFRSPVTQDPVHGVEQFHLSVDLRKRVE